MVFIIPNGNLTVLEQVYSIVVNNSIAWAERGWGASIAGTTLLYVNPVLDNASAKTDMAPFIDYATKFEGDGVVAVLTEYPTWGSFFDYFIANFAVVSHFLVL